jgi:uncharacterized protein (DUF2236 family)
MRNAASLAEPLRRHLAGEVRRLFNDTAKGERPVELSDDALIPRGSVAWRVHGDVTTMMVGGIAALLLQMLHPAALAGVWDHSDFQKDMLGRLRRTARFIAITTYGERNEALAAIARVRRIHANVSGTVPGGAAYSADDPRLLAWIHVAGALCFLDAWIRYAEPAMTRADQDAYFAETAYAAEALGADPVPRNRTDAEQLARSFIPELEANARTVAIRDAITGQKGSLATLPVERLITRSAVDLLPHFARRMHDLGASSLSRPARKLSTMGLARTLRWALNKGSARQA